MQHTRSTLLTGSRIHVFVLFALAATLLSGTTSVRAQDDTTRIVFAAGPDDTGTIRRIIERFNAEHGGRIEVALREMDRDNNAHRRQLVAAFTEKSSAPHVIASDVVWTAQFAAKGWVEDLTDPFYEHYDRDDFLAAASKSAAYRLHIWGIPWYTDTSVLFYRKDLLAASGFQSPPRTWDELITMSQKVRRQSGTPYGFVFQGAEYEGGTANAMEYIWSQDGEVMRGEVRGISPLSRQVSEYDVVTIKSERSAAGLDLARRLIAEGVSPAEVTTYRERESLEAFLAGEAVFLRSWPYVQEIVKRSSLTATQVGVSLLPAASADGVGYSCLGGWNLMVNARASDTERAAAWQLILYLTAPAQQKQQALEAGLLPVLVSLYDDAELITGVPAAALIAADRAPRIHVRPATPFYDELSAHIASTFQKVLKGELTGNEAVARLDEELRAVVMRNR